MPIDHNQIQSILDKLTPEERDVISGQLKARALRKAKTVAANRYLHTFETHDGTQVTFAIGRQKKNLRVYGILQRTRPLSLFASQWLRILEIAGELHTYITKHADRLKEEKKS